VYWLFEQGIPFKEENPIHVGNSLELKRDMDNKSDGYAISLYAFRLRDTIQPSKISSKVIVQLKKLLSRRTFLVRKRAASKVNMKSQEVDLDPDLLTLSK